MQQLIVEDFHFPIRAVAGMDANAGICIRNRGAGAFLRLAQVQDIGLDGGQQRLSSRFPEEIFTSVTDAVQNETEEFSSGAAHGSQQAVAAVIVGVLFGNPGLGKMGDLLGAVSIFPIFTTGIQVVDIDIDPAGNFLEDIDVIGRQGRDAEHTDPLGQIKRGIRGFQEHFFQGRMVGRQAVGSILRPEQLPEHGLPA